ncbi:MAG: DUF362 domain-containing protein [Halobacteriales archaeon]
MQIEFPDRQRLTGASEVDASDLPAFRRARRERDQPAVEDVPAATVEALESIPELDALPDGAEVGITAGSRGIDALPAVLDTAVSELQDRGLEPFVMPAMGSHGGATAEGQVETLASLGITPETVGCEIRSSMDVTQVATGSDGRPVFASVDALDADAVLLVNRIKAHTDYVGDYESGLCKMAVVGLGKHRGAEEMHNAALTRGFQAVIPEYASVLIEETPVVGGLGIIENAEDRAAEIVGVPAGEILDREPALLERSKDLLGTLPVDDLDLLVLEEMGKDVSGTGMDTNVVGRQWFHGQPEPDDAVDVTRIYVRSLTEASHGNALGVGLADFVHRDVVERVDFGDTYVNIATSGEPRRAKLPFVVPTDDTVFRLLPSTTGVDPADLRIAIIPNTLDPDDLLVSEPVGAELESHPDVTLGDPEPLQFDDTGELRSRFGSDG